MRENGVFDKIKNLISVAVFSQDDNVTVEENYATGLEYLDKWLADLTVIDNYEKAEVYLLKALEINSENYGVYPALGTLYQSRWYNDFGNMEFFEKSENNFEKARMCGAVNAYILCNFAMLYLARWENCGYEEIYFNKTESILLKCIELNQEYDKPIRVLGDMYKNMWIKDTSNAQYLEKAESYLKKAYEQNDNDTLCCFNLGYIYQVKWNESDCRDNEWAEKAEEMYLKSVELDSTAYVAMSNVGIIYENRWLQNKSNMAYAEKAVDWYKKSYENDGIYIQGKIHLAKLYPNLYDYNDAGIEYLKNAEELYLELLEVDSENADIFFNFAILNSMIWETNTDNMKYFDKAQSLYIKSIKIDTGYIGAIINLERLYKIQIGQNNKKDLSTDYFNEILEFTTDVIEGDNFPLQDVIQLGITLKELWKLDISKVKYFELSESLLFKALETDDSYQSLDELKELYLIKWNENHEESYFEKIEKLYADKIALDSEDEIAIYGLATIYEHKWFQMTDEKQCFDKAKELYEKCLEIDEQSRIYDDLGYLNSIAWSVYKENDYFEKAEQYYLKAIKMDFFYSKMHLANLYQDKWRSDTTLIEYLEKNIELSESVSKVENYRISAIQRITEIYEELLSENEGNTEYFNKAVRHLDRLFEENDDDAELAGKIGNMYYESGRQGAVENFREAIKWYNTAFGIDSTLDWVASNLGKAYQKLGVNDRSNKYYFETAKRWYEKAIELDITHSETGSLLNLAAITGTEWGNDKSNDALFIKTESLYKKALEIDDSHETAIFNLAFLYRDKWMTNTSKNDLFDKSVQLYEVLIERHTENQTYHNNLGELHMQKWRTDIKNNIYHLEKAKEMLHKAMEIDADYYYPYANLGHIYYELWCIDKSNDEYRELVTQNYERAHQLDSTKIMPSRGLMMVKFYEYESISKDYKTFEEANKYFKSSYIVKSFYDVQSNVTYKDAYLTAAKNFFSKIVKEDKENIEAIISFADIHTMVDIYKLKSLKVFFQAEKYYKSAIAVKEEPEVVAKLALLYAKKYNSNKTLFVYLNKAKSNYKRAIELGLDNDDIKESLGKVI